MMELHDRLDRLAGPTEPATDSQVAADLARGQRALRHRRTVTGAATGVFAVAAAVAVFAYGTAARPADHNTPPVAVAPVVTSHSPDAAKPVATKLVAYEGTQPKGYTIDKVPAGWEIQGVDNYVLTIAPVKAKNKDKDVFVDKIAVMLQSVDEHGTPSGTKVMVAGKQGVLVVPQGSTTGKTLYVKQPKGADLIVQIWDATGWTDDAIVEFAAGIHVLPSAQQGRG